MASQPELELAEHGGAVERERTNSNQRHQQLTATEASQHEPPWVLLRERSDLQKEREQFTADQAALAEEGQLPHAPADLCGTRGTCLTPICLARENVATGLGSQWKSFGG